MRPVPTARRGQTLVLLALTLLLLTLMVMVTLSIGTTAARKADLANAADAAAYSTAVATARTFNTGALLNRTIVSHYVAMSGVEAQMAYASSVHNYMNLAAIMFRLYDDMDSNGDGTIDYVDSYSEPYRIGTCTQRTWEIRDASYELWHHSLRSMRPAGAPNPGDNLNSHCIKGNCAVAQPWLNESEALLEKAAAEQGRAIHNAIWDLAQIQRETYRNLERDVRTAKWPKRIWDVAGLKGGRSVQGEGQSVDELGDATAKGAGIGADHALTFERPLAEAILGTRRRREPLLLPGVLENLPPMVKQMKAITDSAFAAYPNQPFSVDFGAADTSADVSFQDNTRAMVEDAFRPDEPPRTDNEELFPSLQVSTARAVRGTVTTVYRDACLGRQPIRFVSGQRRFNPASGRFVDLTVNGNMETFVRAAGPRQGGGKHVNYGVDHLDGLHWDLMPGGGGCHMTHSHYQWTRESVHDLDEDTLPPDVLAFALPDNDPDRRPIKGAKGVWGQPVLPVVLTQKHRRTDDPFNLNVGFKFTASGARFDMQGAQAETAMAPATGIAYYHRRGHLGEPPNLLNPFWHATLVPPELDERKENVPGGKYDPTEASQDNGGPSRMETLIRNAYGNDARDTLDAYRGLRNDIPGMAKPAPVNGR